MDFKARLFVFGDTSHHDKFDPFPEAVAKSRHELNMHRLKSPATLNPNESTSKQDQQQAIYQELLCEAKRSYHQWRRHHGLHSGVIYDAEVDCRLIKTSNTYIYIFQLKNLVDSKLSLSSDYTDFTYHRNNHQIENLRTLKTSEGNQNLHKSAKFAETFIAASEQREFKAPDHITDEKDKKVLTIFTELFAKQNFFEEDARKNKKFEHDMSVSISSGSDSYDATSASKTASEGTNKLVTVSGATTSIYSIAGDIKQGGDEETLTNMPRINYYPPCFSYLKSLVICLAVLSILATISVLIYDANFNGWVVSSIGALHLFTHIDSLALKNTVLLSLLFVNRQRPERSTLDQNIASALKKNAASIKSYANRMRVEDDLTSKVQVFEKVGIH